MPKTRTKKPTSPQLRPDAKPSDIKTLTAIAKERAQRLKEALRTYRPLPYQEEFHKCAARRSIIRKGNRTGGSLALFVEVARAVLGLDPHGKYPLKGTCVCLGWGEKHIGNIIHKYLFRRGAFYIRQDRQTGEWAGCRQDDPGAEEAPPLIPERYITDMAWEKKNEYIFNKAYIKNPDTGSEWEIIACNSKGDPNMLQGINVNLYAIDEDIAIHGWYVEAMMRTTAVDGLLRWAALPQGENDAMLTLIDECEEQQGSETPTAMLFTAEMWDNTYTSEKSKKQDIETLTKHFGEEIAKRRISGLLDLSTRLVYPSFSKHRHGIDAWRDSKIYRVLKENDWTPPLDWCRYAALDPGHNVFGGVLIGVPPPKEFGDYAVVFGELDIRQADATSFGIEMANVTKNFSWQDFIIDEHGARLTSLGSGEKPRVEYQKALRKHNVRSIASRYGFTSGVDDTDYREVCVREWLRLRDDGTSKLIVVEHKCPCLMKEMLRFKRKVLNKGGETIITEKSDRNGTLHRVDSLEYAAAHGCEYKRPPTAVRNQSFYERMINERRERALRKRRMSPRNGVLLGARGA